MAEIWGAAIAVAGAVGGAVIARRGAKDAANASQHGADAAIAEDRRQFDLMRSDTEPYRRIGAQALGALGNIYGYNTAPQVAVGTPGGGVGNAFAPTPEGGIDRRLVGGDGVQPGAGGATAIGPPMMAGPDYSNFFASPDYNFRRGEGLRGVERTASARGLTGSGNALAALADYNSNLASGEFGNYFNRQAALAGVGQTAVNTSAALGANSAANIGGALIGAADARATGITDSANAFGNALGQIGGIAYDRWGRKKTPAKPVMGGF